MEAGAQARSDKGGEKQGGVAPDRTKAIVDAHQGFFTEMDAIQQGALGRLNESYQSYARQVAELAAQAQAQAQAGQAQAGQAQAAATPEVAAKHQAIHDEYARAVQIATSGAEVGQLMAAAFEKYKAAVIEALKGPLDPTQLALLGQSMQAIAIFAAQLPPATGTV